MDKEKLRALDPDALEAFVRLTSDRVYSLLYRMMGNQEDAEDLTQEAYAKAFRALPAYRGEAAPSTWIYGIALNLGRDAISRRQADRLRIAGAPDPERHASNDDPLETSVRSAESSAIAGALDAIDEGQREIVILADVEGMAMEEIAAILCVEIGTVKSRLHRARAAAREEFKKRMGNWP